MSVNKQIIQSLTDGELLVFYKQSISWNEVRKFIVPKTQTTFSAEPIDFLDEMNRRRLL
jgi:hypothetical protein